MIGLDGPDRGLLKVHRRREIRESLSKVAAAPCRMASVASSSRITDSVKFAVRSCS